MIRVELGAEIRPGVFAWSVPSLSLSGESRQPLLDACRQLKPLLDDTRQFAGLFRPGKSSWDARCSVEWGATHRIRDSGIGFRREDFERLAALGWRGFPLAPAGEQELSSPDERQAAPAWVSP
jgi:hypothetical protein